MIKNFLKGIFSHTFLIFISLISIFPFLWLISTALKGIDENIFQYPPVFFPEHPTWANFKGVWHQIPFILYFINSMVVAGFTVVLNLILSALAAYPLARMDFKGKKVVPFSTQGSNYGTFFEDFSARAQNAQLLQGASFNNLPPQYDSAVDNKINAWLNALS